jgi:hypothetical protein
MQVQGTRSPIPTQSVGQNTASNLLQDNLGSSLVSELQGRYANMAYNKQLFMANAIVTAPVIFSTAAGTGGPLIWNGSTAVNVHLLAVGFGITVVSTVAAALGITGNTGQSVAPTATTAIDSKSNLYIGGPASQSTQYRIGTPASAGGFFMPFADLDTGALTTSFGGMNWVDLGGAIIVPPNCWASIAASATASTTVGNFGMIFAEVPI